MQHTTLPIAPTPIAAAAIMAQISQRGSAENTFYADVCGVEWEFEARFDVAWERVGYFGQRDYDEASCDLIGAWSYDEDGNVAFAGNRAELVALIGEVAVSAWEYEQAGREME